MKSGITACIGASLFILLSLAVVQPAAADECEPNEMWVSSDTVLNNDGVGAGQSGYCAPVAEPQSDPKPPKEDGPPSDSQPVKVNPFEYSYAYACGSIDRGSLVPGRIVGEPCETAALACEFQGATAGAQRLNVYRRLRTGGPWQLSGTSCGPSDIPPGAPAPPPIPTLAQIRQAFLSLPFAKPTVNIQPEGDVTLVNLSTYFEAQWPAGKLGPGDVSNPVQLLSWSIEFRINPAEYNYDFGDGTSCGPTADLGGPYPVGKVRHIYKQSNPAAAVKVDAKLSGSYRVNGGTNWIPLSGIADLQDEPIATLQVREAKAHLYNN